MATTTAKSEDGMYLIFQSSSDDGKIYTIPQAYFGDAIDPKSEQGMCILENFRLLKSNLVGVVFAILISTDDKLLKTCGPSGPPPRPPPGR